MSVYKRTWKQKNGSTASCWYFHRTIDGVRYRDRLPTARTKAQAEEAERHILAAIHDGKYTGGSKTQKTLKEFAHEVYIPWAKENKTSWRGDASMLKVLVRILGKKKLTEISQFDVEKLKSHLRKTLTRRETPMSASYVNKHLKMLSKIFRLAKVKNNPCDEVKRLGGETKRKRWLRPEEREKLQEALQSPRRVLLAQAIELDLNTGLRRGELLSLKPDDIDFHRGLLMVRAGKTGAREVPINTRARLILSDLVSQASASGWEYLFTNPRTGTRIKDLKKSFKNALKDAGIEDFTFHDLRHTFGTIAVDRGAPLTGVRDALGHTTLETTNRYVHATDEGKRRAVEAAGEPQRSGIVKMPESGHKAVTKDQKREKKVALNG